MAFDYYEEISAEGRENVVANSYLHSNPFLFRNAVAGGLDENISLTGSTKNPFHRDEGYKNELKNKLKDMKDKMEEKEKQFYRIFGIRNGNIEQMARDFNNKLKKSLKIYEVLKYLNSPSFYKQLEEVSVNEMLNHLSDKIGIALYENMEGDENRKTLLGEFYNTIRERIDVIYLNYNDIKGKRRQTKDYTKDLTLTKEFIKRLKFVFERECPEVAEKEARDYNKVLTDKVISFLGRYTKDQDVLNVIRFSCQKVFQDYGASLKNSSNRVGAIGEMANNIVFDRLIEYFRDEVGLELEMNNLYIGNAIDSKYKTKPPIDFLIGKFGIQAKNSGLLLDNFADIKAVSRLKLDSFIDKLAFKLGENTANQYSYLVENIIWLNNNGLNKRGQSERLMIADIPYIMAFITDILSQAADIILTKRNLDEMGTEKRFNSYGNVFFIYKNTYLIPISVMVDGMIQAIDLDRESESEGIGFFSRKGISKDFGKNSLAKQRKVEIESGGGGALNAEELQDQKRKNLPKDDGSKLNYVGELLRIGSEAGDSYRSGINININYTLAIKNLAKMYETYGIWEVIS